MFLYYIREVFQRCEDAYTEAVMSREVRSVEGKTENKIKATHCISVHATRHSIWRVMFTPCGPESFSIGTIEFSIYLVENPFPFVTEAFSLPAEPLPLVTQALFVYYDCLNLINHSVKFLESRAVSILHTNSILRPRSAMTREELPLGWFPTSTFANAQADVLIQKKVPLYMEKLNTPALFAWLHGNA
jgi:hypothetical protein